MKNPFSFFKRRSKQIDCLIDLQVKNNVILNSINQNLAKLAVIIDYRGKAYDPKGFESAMNEANGLDVIHTEKFNAVKKEILQDFGL